MGVDQTESLPAELLQGLEPLLKEVVSLTEKIKELDRRVEQIAREDWMLEAAYGVCHSARPEPWYPYVFTSPEEAAEAGVCAVNPDSRVG